MRLTEIFFGKRLSKYLKSDEPETKGIIKFMFFGERLQFNSPYPPEVAATRLSQNIIETPILTWWFPEDALVGRVKVNKVKLMWVMANIRNSFNLIFSGRFKANEKGSILVGVYRLPLFVIIFLCLWFGGLAFASLAAIVTISTEINKGIFDSSAGLGLVFFVIVAFLMGAGGIGLVAFAKRISRDSLINMTEIIEKSIGSQRA